MKYVEKIAESVLLRAKLCGDNIYIDTEHNYIKIGCNSSLSVVIRNAKDNSTFNLTIKELYKNVHDDTIGRVVNTWIEELGYINIFPLEEFTGNATKAIKYWSNRCDNKDYRDTYWLNGYFGHLNLRFGNFTDFLISPDDETSFNIIYMSKSGRGIIYYRSREVSSWESRMNKRSKDHSIYTLCKIGCLVNGNLKGEKKINVDLDTETYKPDYNEFVQICKRCEPYLDIVRNAQ